MDDIDHLQILRCLKELPFPVGKGTLAEILVGATTKRMLASNTYMELKSYGSLEGHQQARIEQLIDRLVTNGLIVTTGLQGQPHIKVLKLTPKGLQEMKTPRFGKNGYSKRFNADTLDTQSELLIGQFGFFLSSYNKEQQHAIVSPAKRILCVAGAGTGKTTVLTKRIEFLVKYRGVDPKGILAITFTRKARAEMQHRLAGIGAHITTFNGFCEQLLRKSGQAKPLVTYGQKVRLFNDAIAAEGLELRQLVFDYFTEGQRKGAMPDELERRLMGDVYSIIDHYANEDEPIPESGQSELATTLLSIARRIDAAIAHNGLRDYSGQLRDALALLRARPELRPTYAHILVDEYQDVNIAQQRLLELLDPEHLFVVGDPRQSIFGWRGSQIRFIAEFPAERTVQLHRNYRSRPEIVQLMNRLITGMGLPDLESSQAERGTVQTLKYASEDEELLSIANILTHTTEKDLFILARTNRQLQDLSAILNQKGIRHSIRKEEDEADPSGIVLATAHAIKGLEASTVIVMGVTSRYFPCKVSDHPVVDLIRDAHFDREEEERRLLYVALSRAKERLIITYTTSTTYFLDGVFGPASAAQKQAKRAGADYHRSAAGDAAFERLQEWRSRLAKQRGLPAYCICADRTLHELVEQRPRTIAEMEGIYGLGEARLRQFGDELLELLHQ